MTSRGAKGVDSPAGEYQGGRSTIVGSPQRREVAQAWKGNPTRSFLIAGVIILALGAFVLIRGGTIPTWGGGAAVAGGIVLIAAGMRKRA